MSSASRSLFSRVPDDQLLDVLSAEWRQLSRQQARVWAAMAELATRDPMASVAGAVRWTPEQVFDSAVAEMRAELRITRRFARAELERADLVTSLPAVADALADGRIDRARALVLAQGCWDLAPEHQAKLLDEVLPRAGEVTATGLTDRVRRVAIALDPAWAERRYREAVHSRRFIGYLNDDGSATVSGQHLPANEAAAACARVTALANAAKRAGATAPIDYLRAELFLGLLDGRFQGLAEDAIIAALVERLTAPSEMVKPGVEMHVALTTLLGSDDKPGEIAGWGPVPASVARETVAGQRRCEWRFAVVDSDGRLLFDSITRRRPRGQAPGPAVRGGIVELHVPADLLDDPALADRFPDWAEVLADIAAQYAKQAPIEQDPAARFPGRPLRRRSQIRHRSCLFPGCRRPATDCQQDHRRDHANGGPTSEANLGPGCAHDHDLKTKHGWRLIKRDETTYVWISPLGRRHLTRIDPIAPPLPDADPDPPPF